MSKTVNETKLDAALALFEGTKIHVCSAAPANYAGIAAVQLATATISGAYVKSAGDTSGRKNTLPAQAAVPISATGTANHVAVSDGSSDLFIVTSLSATQALTSGGTVDVGAFDHEINAPT